jgi:hypothetical protein
VKIEYLEKTEIVEKAENLSGVVDELFEGPNFVGNRAEGRHFSVTLAGDAIEKDCIIYVNCSLNLDPPNHPAACCNGDRNVQDRRIG